MKLDALFYVENGKLFRIADQSCVDLNSLKKIEIKWTTVEIEEEAYNEEYLAQLRDELKQMEVLNQFAILIPVVDKALETPEQVELFINAFNHTARRIKDCVSVVGFELPAELTQKGFEPGSPAADFMDTIAIKHEQYINFSKDDKAPKNAVVLL